MKYKLIQNLPWRFGNFFRMLSSRGSLQCLSFARSISLTKSSADSNLTVTPNEYPVCRVLDQRWWYKKPAYTWQRRVDRSKHGRSTCDFCRRAPKFTNIIQPGSKVNVSRSMYKANACLWIIQSNVGSQSRSNQPNLKSKTIIRHYCKVDTTQPRSQGLSSYRPLERAKRDPGWVWSRVSQNLGDDN